MLICKGDPDAVQPCFLAHTDQVHCYQPGFKVDVIHVKGVGSCVVAYDGNDEQCGVGGDDKCGIYLCIRMLMAPEIPNCKVVFVCDEEVGCVGSRRVPLSWFDNVSFVLQGDRRHDTADLITSTNGYEISSEEFTEAMLGLSSAVSGGFQENEGSVTDVGELGRRNLRVSMMNVSCGYHFAHTDSEYVVLSELAITENLFFEAATELGTTEWHHNPTSVYGLGGYGKSVYGASMHGGPLMKDNWTWGRPTRYKQNQLIGGDLCNDDYPYDDDDYIDPEDPTLDDGGITHADFRLDSLDEFPDDLSHRRYLTH